MPFNPSLTIITVNLNNAIGLEKTIKSVIQQSFTNFEFIIIDGGSSDESLNIIKQYPDQINYWVSEPDKGIYHAMNKGILRAHGKYCLFLNSGDFLFEKITLQKVFLHQQKADILYGNLVYEETNEIIRYPEKLTLHQFIFNTIGHPSTFIKTDLLHNYKFYNEKLKIAADLEFFIKAIIFGNCSTHYLNENIAYFNQNGISSKNLTLSLSERESVLKSLLPQRILDDYIYQFQPEINNKKNLKFKSKVKKLLSNMIKGQVND